MLFTVGIKGLQLYDTVPGSWCKQGQGHRPASACHLGPCRSHTAWMKCQKEKRNPVAASSFAWWWRLHSRQRLDPCQLAGMPLQLCRGQIANGIPFLTVTWTDRVTYHGTRGCTRNCGNYVDATQNRKASVMYSIVGASNMMHSEVIVRRQKHGINKRYF